MPDTDTTPLAQLEVVLPRLEKELGPRSGEPVALDGGITNRNYRVTLGGQDCVVRMCGKATAALGIDRDTEQLAAARAAGLGIGPRVLTRLKDLDVLVCEFVPGTALTELRLQEPETLRAVGSALRAFHCSGALPTAFAVFDLVQRQAQLPRAQVPADHAELVTIAERIRAAVAGHPEHASVPCHNDLLAANFLRSSDRVMLLDWEYAGMNDPFFDLGNLAVNNGLDDAATDRLLAAGLGEPPTDRRRAALTLFRMMSDFREAMWGVAQGVLSELDFDYQTYARTHFDRLREQVANPGLEELIRIAASA